MVAEGRVLIARAELEDVVRRLVDFVERRAIVARRADVEVLLAAKLNGVPGDAAGTIDAAVRVLEDMRAGGTWPRFLEENRPAVDRLIASLEALEG